MSASKLKPVIGIAMLAMALAAILVGPDTAQIKFTPEYWRDRAKTDDGQRLRMVDDLLRSKDFQGKQKEEVVALLGEPDGKPAAGYDLSYRLNKDSSRALVYRLDSEGRVVEYRKRALP